MICFNTTSKTFNHIMQTAVTNVALDFTGLQALKKYFCQLEFLSNRFPLTSADPASISFEWLCILFIQIIDFFCHFDQILDYQ